MKNRVQQLLDQHRMSAAECARRVGMSAPQLRNYARGDNVLTSQAAEKIAKLFKVSVGFVLGVESEATPASPLPVYGPVAAGSLSNFKVDITRAVSETDRPPFLVDVPDAYAVVVIGNSMAPRFRPGELVYINPMRPARSGDDVVVRMHDGTAVLKEYVEHNEQELVVCGTTDRTLIRFPLDDVEAIHTVQGTFLQ